VEPKTGAISNRRDKTRLLKKHGPLAKERSHGLLFSGRGIDNQIAGATRQCEKAVSKFAESQLTINITER
jgi:hypothetical protein